MCERRLTLIRGNRVHVLGYDHNPLVPHFGEVTAVGSDVNLPTVRVRLEDGDELIFYSYELEPIH